MSREVAPQGCIGRGQGGLPVVQGAVEQRQRVEALASKKQSVHRGRGSQAHLETPQPSLPRKHSLPLSPLPAQSRLHLAGLIGPYSLTHSPSVFLPVPGSGPSLLQPRNSMPAGGAQARHRTEQLLPRTTPCLDAGLLPGLLTLSGPTENRMQGWGSWPMRPFRLLRSFHCYSSPDQKCRHREVKRLATLS